jgi:hypothetical protein
MATKISKSRDNSGEMGPPQNGAASATVTPINGVVNQNSTERDLLINYNAQVMLQRNMAYGNPTFSIDTNFDIKNTEPVSVMADGVYFTLGDNTSFNTGTTATITATLWGIAILTWDGTTATVSWATTAAAMGYATEALAIAALGQISTLIPAAGFASLGYVTVQAGAALWTAGTDALEGGSGGTVANDTNYYNDPSLNGTFGGWLIGNESGTQIVQ